MQDAIAMSTDRRERFAALLGQHRKIVFKVANSYAWHPDDRAELAQEIAAQLWRAFAAYDAARPFSTWMYRIALNVAISQVRAGRLDTVSLDEAAHDVADDGTTDHETRQLLIALDRVIAAFDPLNRALLLLWLEDRGNREIGEILGLSETNVSTRLSRLRQRIRDELA